MPTLHRPEPSVVTSLQVTTAQAQGEQRILALSTVAFTLLFAVWLMYGVLGVGIKQELHLSTVQFAWLTATAVLSGALLRLPFGIITDRLGGRLTFTGLLLLTAVPCGLVALAHTYSELMWAALAFGIAGNSFSIGIAWNSTWARADRQGLALGIFGAGNVGASITKLIGPGLIALVPAAGWCGGLIPGGWRLIPIVYAVLLVVMAVVLWFGTPSPDRRPGRGRTLGSMMQPLRSLRVWRFGLYYVAVFGAYVALSLWLPNFYKEVYGLSLAHAALLTTLFIFPASLLRPFGGWLADRWGARVVTVAAFSLMLVSSIPLAVPRSVMHVDVGLFTVLVCLLGIGMGIGKASVYRYVPDYFPKDVGAVGGLVGSLGALGGFVLPLAFGYAAKLTGSPESCFLIIAVLNAGCLLWLMRVVVGIKRRQDIPAIPMNAVGLNELSQA